MLYKGDTYICESSPVLSDNAILLNIYILRPLPTGERQKGNNQTRAYQDEVDA